MVLNRVQPLEHDGHQASHLYIHVGPSLDSLSLELDLLEDPLEASSLFFEKSILSY